MVDTLARLTFLVILPTYLCVAQDFTIQTIAGGHSPTIRLPANRNFIPAPQSVAVDNVGRVYFVADDCVFRVGSKGDLSIVAGNGRRGFSGDGGPALEAQLSSPQGLFVSDTGVLYIADTSNHRIRRVSSSGIISTIAGTGRPGYSGDGEQALRATLYYPQAVTVDQTGAIYIADTRNNRIRRIDDAGFITTVAGNGMQGSTGDGGPAIRATLNLPMGIAVDSHGRILIADTLNCLIRSVSDGMISTVVDLGATYSTNDPFGKDSATPTFPTSISLDSAGVILVATPFQNKILRLAPSGALDVFAGSSDQGFGGDGGPALSAQLSSPLGVASTSDGSTYIADTGNHRLRRVTSQDIILTVAGTGPSDCYDDDSKADLSYTDSYSQMVVDSQQTIYVSNGSNVKRIFSDGRIRTILDLRCPPFAASLAPRSIDGIAVNSSGTLFVSDADANQIWKVDHEGVFSIVAGGERPGYSGDGGSARQALLNRPKSIAFDRTNQLFIADSGNNRIRRIGVDGVIRTVAGTGVGGFSGDGGPSEDAQLNFPSKLVFNTQGDLAIYDELNARIRVIRKTGVIETVLGGGEQDNSSDDVPANEFSAQFIGGIAIDSVGNIYFTDAYAQRVRRLSTGNLVTTVAGTGEAEYSGDGGLALRAGIVDPGAIGILGTDSVVFTQQRAIRKLIPASAPCVYAVVPTIIRVPVSSTSITVSVQTGEGCGWAVIKDSANWIHSDVKIGIGSKTVFLLFRPTMDTLSHIAIINIAGIKVTVERTNSTDASCDTSTFPKGVYFNSDAASAFLKVDTQQGCAWTLGSLPAWLNVSPAPNGMGPGTLRLDAAPNSFGKARSAELKLGSEIIRIEQYGVVEGRLPVIQIVPFLITGDGWSTEISIINPNVASSDIRLLFYSNVGLDSASYWRLPQKSFGPVLASRLERTLAPHSVLWLDSLEWEPTSAWRTGWVEIQSSQPVFAFALLRRTDQMKATQFTVSAVRDFVPHHELFAFNNSAPNRTFLTFTNHSLTSNSVEMLIRDDSGVLLQRVYQSFKPKEQLLIDLGWAYPVSGNRRGTLEISSTGIEHIHCTVFLDSSITGVSFVPHLVN